MLKKSGFTLIELLVVIAIITILASIVAPKVQGWIERGKMAKAVSEVRNADLALVKMLADVERKSFGQLFTAVPCPTGTTFDVATKLYTDAFYELLRLGKGTVYDHATGLMDISVTDPQTQIVYGIRLDTTAVKKLGTAYMDINLDPWGKAYQFYVGPLKLKTNLQLFPNDFPPFRSYRDDSYVYNLAEKQILDAQLRGNPQPDDHAGFPCPKDLPVYIYSMGGNQVSNQPWSANIDTDLGVGGGDDINNWDTTSGWSALY